MALNRNERLKCFSITKSQTLNYLHLKRDFILLLLILFTFSSCKQSKEGKIDKISDYPYVDERVVILKDSLRYYWLKKRYGYEPWQPTEEDLKNTQTILERAIANHEFDFIKKPIKSNIEKYYRQYIPFLNEKGEKAIEINAFCELLIIPPKKELAEIGVTEWTEMDWKNYYVQVDDGGPCYWKIEINIDKMSYESVMVNGF